MKRNHQLKRVQEVSLPIDEVFAFFANAENLEALTPPFLGFQILSPLPIEMREGARIDYSLSLAGIPLKWRTHITCWEPGRRFVDEQESGPYALWRHTHEFEAQGSTTVVRDLVEYREPLGVLGWVAHVAFVQRTLVKIFDYRHEQVARLLPKANHELKLHQNKE
jgi:ligand-binding SRPBCC domain-containing protein